MASSEERSPIGARSAVWPAAVASGSLVAQHVAGRATRDALFLSHFGLGLLPDAMIGAAVLSLIAVLAISWTLARSGPALVVPTLFALSAALFLVESWLSLRSERAATVAVYAHIAVFSSTAVSAFWSLVNERFDPHEAKKLVGRIASGGTVGGILGGVVTWRAAAHLSVPSMLALLAGINAVGLGASLSVARGAHGTGETVESVAGGGWKVVRELPYLRDLALLVLAGAIVQALLDWLLSAHASHAYGKGAELLGFFALFNMVVGVLSFVAQTSLSRPLLERRGLVTTVQSEPVAVVLCSVLALIAPHLSAVVLLRGGEAVTRNSLYRSAYELFYTPLPTAKKRATKTLIDVGVDRAGTMLASVGLLAVVHLGLDDATRIVLIAAMALAGVAWLVSTRLHEGYVSALAASLESGAIALGNEETMDLTTRKTLAETTALLDAGKLLARVERFQSAKANTATGTTEPVTDDLGARVRELGSGDTARTKAALAAPLSTALVAFAIPLLANDAVARDAVRALRNVAPRATGQLLDALLDHDVDVRVRRRLPRVLKVCRTERAAAGLFMALGDPVFDVRTQVALALTEMQDAGQVVLAREKVFDLAVHELTACPEPDDAERSRRLGHVFTMLGLVLEREPLRIAHRTIRGDDPRLRGTAQEYLEVTLPQRVRDVLLPLLGAPQPASARST
ncbi:MAG TPA: hypothetical protein VH062_07860 [Polyangiaceae bacterium]|jgi:hypothetical protein|nr:hypothetical protein [Polyangiaceae bacterium]